MRFRSASLAGTLAALAACGGPAPRPVPAATAAARPPEGPHSSRERAESLRRARVWREPAQPIAAALLAANPPGADSFRTDEEVPCTFVLRDFEGTNPKFECRLGTGEEVKVKYGRNSVEVFAEVAATRLLAALGFGADRMYVVRAVRCRGCPLYPYPRVKFLDAVRRSAGREVTFKLAVIERKMPGRTIEYGENEGWAWFELDRIDPAAGGSSRAEVDALRLAAVFLNHWDSKSENQRIVCLPGGEGPEGCSRPFALLHDVGQTFGPRAVDLDRWRATPVWADAASCRVSMKGLPYDGATFGEAHITEAGRRFLGDRLRQLSHAQVVALFAAARFPQFAPQTEAGRDVENWADAFEDRVRQIADRAPCPQ
jgi:hypothetical protein